MLKSRSQPPPHLHQGGASRYTNDGTVDVNGQPAVKASTGNWRACFFALGIQFSECLAFFAISKNLVTYLTSVLHESNIDPARNLGLAPHSSRHYLELSLQTRIGGAARNRHLELPEDCTTLHYMPSSPSEATFSAQHTTQFRFLDKAAIVSPSAQEKKGVATSPWRLCALSCRRGEDAATSVPCMGVLADLLHDHGTDSSTVIEQGMAMDNRMGSSTVPPASLASFNVITTLVLIPIYDAVLVPLARHATGEDRGLTQQQRLGVGLALSTLAMAYLALLERNRLAKAAIGEAVSIMWQAPAYAVMGVSEVFTVIGTLELFYDRAPDNIRSLCTAFGQLAIAAGSYLNSAALGVVASATMWIPEDHDNGHLDYFFWTIVYARWPVSALNLLQFTSQNLLQFVLYSLRHNDNVACRQRHPY